MELELLIYLKTSNVNRDYNRINERQKIKTLPATAAKHNDQTE